MKSKIIYKKVWPKYFQDIVDGKKDFEIRLADFECKKGDTLILEEWIPETKEYTGRRLEVKVKYNVKTKDLKFWSKKEVDKHGFQIIGFNRIEDKNKT